MKVHELFEYNKAKENLKRLDEAKNDINYRVSETKIALEYFKKVFGAPRSILSDKELNQFFASHFDTALKKKERDKEEIIEFNNKKYDKVSFTDIKFKLHNQHANKRYILGLELKIVTPVKLINSDMIDDKIYLVGDSAKELIDDFQNVIKKMINNCQETDVEKYQKILQSLNKVLEI